MFGKMKSNGRPAPAPAAKPAKATTSAEYSNGVRQVNKKGYEVYNVSDVGQIFIAKAPESAFFNNGNDMIVKAESGKMIGLYRPTTKMQIETIDTTPNEAPTNMFENIKRGSEMKIESFTGTYSNGIVKRKPTEIH